MNNLPPVPLNLINLFGFYVKMKTNVSKPEWENNRFSFMVYRGPIFNKTVVISKQIKLVTPETAQMTDFFKGFLNVIDFDKFLLD